MFYRKNEKHYVSHVDLKLAITDFCLLDGSRNKLSTQHRYYHHLSWYGEPVSKELPVYTSILYGATLAFACSRVYAHLIPYNICSAFSSIFGPHQLSAFFALKLLTLGLVGKNVAFPWEQPPAVAETTLTERWQWIKAGKVRTGGELESWVIFSLTNRQDRQQQEGCWYKRAIVRLFQSAFSFTAAIC